MLLTESSSEISESLHAAGLMVHRTIKTTQIYVKTTRKRKIDVIKFLNERNKPQKKMRVKKVEKGASTATF